MKLPPKNQIPQPGRAIAHASAASHRFPSRRAFTLIELLVVITIIAILAAFILPLAGSVGRVKKINTAQAEMQKIESALENYKAKYGVYPPSNPNPSQVFTNSLYYELTGVTNDGTYYRPLDGSDKVKISFFTAKSGLGGVVNSSKGGGDETVYAKDFLPDLKASQIAFSTNAAGNSTYYYLVTSVAGPDVNYQPLSGAFGASVNPFRYLYPGTNNPNSYDLWVELSINSKTGAPHYYLICNWSQQTLRNSPLP